MIEVSKYEAAKAIRDAAELRVKVASAALQKYPRGPMGLTPDSVKESPERQKDKAAYNAAFADLRAINETILKKFRKEYLNERKAKQKGSME